MVKDCFLAYSVQSRGRSVLVVRINDWKICLNRVPWFSTDSTATNASWYFFYIHGREGIL